MYVNFRLTIAHALTTNQVFGYLFSDDENVVKLVAKVIPFVAFFQVSSEIASKSNQQLHKHMNVTNTKVIKKLKATVVDPNTIDAKVQLQTICAAMSGDLVKGCGSRGWWARLGICKWEKQMKVGFYI